MWYMAVPSPFSLLILTSSSRVMASRVWEIRSLIFGQRSRLAQVPDREQAYGFFTQSTRQISPSRISTISLSVISVAGFARVYPPWAPRVELTQIGKVCHDRCAIFHQVGDCVMPREGVFVEVIIGGEVSVGDTIRMA